MAIAVSHPRTRSLTWDDVQEFPDDGRRYELVDGVLIVSPSPAVPHQLCVGAVYRLLHQHAPPDVQVLVGPFDWYVRADTFFEPDVLVYRRGDATHRRLEVPPVVAVEVLSPSTRHLDLGTKRLAYAEAGLPWYWVVDPSAPSLTVFANADRVLEPVRTVAGDEAADLADPFPVRVVPADLLA